MTTPAPSRPLQWSRLSEIYVVNGPARLYADNAVYAMIGTQPPAGTTQPNVWHTIDLKPFGVGPDAKAAFLSGLLIITQGATPCTADMQIVFRASGSTTGALTVGTSAAETRPRNVAVNICVKF